MVRMFIKHPVEDYDRWRQGYDAFQPKAREKGSLDGGVFQSVDDVNDITAFHDFADIETARAFVDDPDLKQAMGEAGVAGEPIIWFTEPR